MGRLGSGGPRIRSGGEELLGEENKNGERQKSSSFRNGGMSFFG